MKAVMIIMGYDLAVELYSEIDSLAVSADSKDDIRKCVAQAIGKPMPIDKDVVSPGPSTEPLEGDK